MRVNERERERRCISVDKEASEGIRVKWMLCRSSFVKLVLCVMVCRVAERMGCGIEEGWFISVMYEGRVTRSDDQRGCTNASAHSLSSSDFSASVVEFDADI